MDAQQLASIKVRLLAQTCTFEEASDLTRALHELGREEEAWDVLTTALTAAVAHAHSARRPMRAAATPQSAENRPVRGLRSRSAQPANNRTPQDA